MAAQAVVVQTACLAERVLAVSESITAAGRGASGVALSCKNVMACARFRVPLRQVAGPALLVARGIAADAVNAMGVLALVAVLARRSVDEQAEATGAAPEPVRALDAVAAVKALAGAVADAPVA